MFFAVAMALAHGLGVRRGRLSATLLATVVSLVFCALAVVVETIAATDVRYYASLAVLGAALVVFTAVFVGGSAVMRAIALVSCLFSLTCARSVVTAAYQAAGIDSLLDSSFASMVFYLLLYAAYAAIAMFFARRPLHSAALLPAKAWFVLLVPPAAVATAAQLGVAWFALDTSSLTLSLLLQGIALVSIMSLYELAVLTTEAYDTLLEEQSINQRLALTVDHIERSGVIADRVRRDKHEMKNVLFYVQSLVRTGHMDELEAFLDAEVAHFDAMTEFHTGNDLLDYLLTQKYAEVRDAGARAYFDIAVPEGLAIGGGDLCGLLSNLLDNAIDASRSEASADAEVRLLMRVTRGYLSIKVSNRTSTDVLAANPELHTTKARSSEHGVGLGVVRSIVQKREGLFTTTMEDGCFVASALLRLE